MIRWTKEGKVDRSWYDIERHIQIAADLANECEELRESLKKLAMVVSTEQ